MGKNKKRKSTDQPAGNASSGRNKKDGSQGASSSGGSMQDWISNLAKSSVEQQASSNTTKNAVVGSKEERKAKRAAKKARRQDRLDQKMQNRPERLSESDYIKQKKMSPSEQALTRQRLQDLIDHMHLVKAMMEEKRDTSKNPRTFPYSGDNKVYLGKRKWDDDGIQPRPRDYGGIGLARPSLFLPFEDPAWLPKLEQEFAEHIPGFFGKQRTKAMKKQLNANMLWKRMLEEKQAKRKKQKNMSADERAEAMMKTGLV